MDEVEEDEVGSGRGRGIVGGYNVGAISTEGGKGLFGLTERRRARSSWADTSIGILIFTD